MLMPADSFDQGAGRPIFGLGIDAGGTFTDAVIVDVKGTGIVAQAKAPTNTKNPVEGIRAALNALPTGAVQAVHFVSLATTFATNAIVEGKGATAGLILVGYDRDHPALSRMSPVLFLGGGHDYWGKETAPLEFDLLESRLGSFARDVDAIAVSGFFSIRNPEHELRVARYILDHCSKPVVCGHQLSARLDAPKRATTAWWNARLIPLISRLIVATQEVLSEFGVQAPLMVVRGDGTLMASLEAIKRPVETVLSGPAASILGAKYLTGQESGLVVDMGGTTTDMAVLKGGRVEIDPEGAQVGDWKTQVEAARIRTTGLGGDSWIRTEDGTMGGLCIGPNRVEPLCVMAARFPEVLSALRELEHSTARIPLLLYDPCTFYVSEGKETADQEKLPWKPGQSPENQYRLLSDPSNKISRWELLRLERRGGITRTALTPTDFCVAAGRYDLGSREAARLGISILARGLGTDEARLFEALEEEIARRLCLESAALLFGKDAPALFSLAPYWFPKKGAGGGTGPAIQLDLKLNHPVMAVGAPAEAWLPQAFEHLHTSCTLPAHFMVGTAIGAAVGTVGFTLTAEVRPFPKNRYVLYSPNGKWEFSDHDEAVREGRKTLKSLAAERMKANNIKAPVMEYSSERLTVPVPGGEHYLCTLLMVRATGRMNEAI